MIFYDEFYFDLDVSLNFLVDLIDHRRLTYVLYIIEKSSTRIQFWILDAPIKNLAILFVVAIAWYT